MKKSVIILLAITSIVLAGCQNNQTSQNNQTTGSNTTEEKTVPAEDVKQPGTLKVEQVFEDGTSQEVMKLGADKIKSGSTVTPGVKGIAITSKGFEPSEITMKVGDKITFANMDTNDHWPASDPHPVHSIEPGLDPKKALAPKETFEYSFEKAGTFPFHDHLNPTYKGIITVEE